MRSVSAILFALSLCLSVPVFGAVAHDGEANLSAVVSATDPWDIQDKTTAGANRCAVVRIETSQTTTVTSITYNAVAMTQVGTPVDITAGSARRLHFYIIAAPPTAASDIAIDFNASATGSYLVSSFSGCDQADPIGDNQTASGSGTSASVAVTAAAGDIVLDYLQAATSTITEDGGQTLEMADLNRSSFYMAASRENGAASVTMSWTISSAAWGIRAFSINQASAAGNTPLRRRRN